jgi:glutamine cyclotransferase
MGGRKRSISSSRSSSLLALAAVAMLVALWPSAVARQRRPAPVYGFKLVATFPHDPTAFTQGLVFADGELYESTGLQGESSLRRVELRTGRVLQQIKVPDEYFAEGLALVGDALIQLTWQNKVGFVYDRKTFGRRRTFPYSNEGWGLAYDGASRLVMSDGSARLFYLDPKTLTVTGTITVRDAGTPVDRLNELEWVDNEIWANVWTTDRIVRIAPSSGDVTGWVALDSLWPRAERRPPADVMNGLAYDKTLRRIFVTGKKWPSLYQIAITQK